MNTLVFLASFLLLFLCGSNESIHAQYCSAGSNNLNYEEINRVQFVNIDNSSGISSGGYHDYTSLSTNVSAGNTYGITVTNAINDQGSQCGIWIDWNQDEDFEDAGESYTTTRSTYYFTTNITVPGTARTGSTRMRIRMKYTGSLDPCGTEYYGETEDYTVYVLQRITTGIISPDTYCAGAAIDIPYTVDDPFISGNVFTAQLSDATGDFSSPVDIGTLTSTTNGTISATIPAGTQYGTGYEIRVVGNNPVVTGTASTSNLTINEAPTINGTTPGYSCGPGIVYLEASASAGIINWYDAASGGSALSTGSSYTTPSLSSTSVYYVDATDNGCTTSSRTSIEASVNTIPEITGTTPGSRVGTGTVQLGATASNGSVDWYDLASGGNLLGSGNNFTTPVISVSTTFYAEASDNECISATRTPVTATIAPLPDNDADGVPDTDDLDDDNDGILDIIEMNCGEITGYDAYWPMENSTEDESGNGHDQINGSVSFSPDSKKGSYSASFNGSSNYIQYSDGSFLNQSITYFSYAFWVKPANLSGTQCLLDEGGGVNGLAIRLNNNTLENAVREGGSSSQVSTSSFTFPNDGEWHHVALTYNNGIVIMYLDAVASTTLNTGFGQLASHSSAHSFGRSSSDAFGQGTGDYFEGLMDDIIHYPSVLSAQDVYDIVYGSCDNDNDGITNEFDLDSDNDGCSDANEAYADVDTDGGDDGVFGLGAPAVDGDGKVIAASYTSPATTSGGQPTYLQAISVNIDTGVDDVTECAGNNAEFSASADVSVLPTLPTTTSGTDLTYQWQLSTDGGNSFTDISGESGTVGNGVNLSLNLTSITPVMDGYIYKVVFTNEANICGASSEATLHVEQSPVASFYYPGTPYCPNASNVLPAYTGGGQAGTFSSTSGLVFENALTGEVNALASIPGNYTVTNTITSSGCGNAVETNQITILNKLTWNGSLNTDWNTIDNWTCGLVPTINRDVQIANVINQPVLSTGTVGTVKDIEIDNGATVTVINNTIQIAGDINNIGTFNSKQGTVEFKGSGTQNIPAGTFKDDTIKNITINNASGVNLLGPLYVTGIVSTQNGDFASDGNLTLISNASGTALIDGSGTGLVSGNVTMQRYLPTGFGYKNFSSPFTESTVFEFADEIDLNADFPPFYSYDEDQNSAGWVNYSNQSGTLNPLQGYAINFGDNTDAITVDASGSVNNGDLTVNLYNHNQTYTQGFNLVGNPFPSPIDWDAPVGWNKTNIDNALYYFKASSSDQYGGTYSTYINGISSDGAATNIIPSMQGFFVHVSDGSYPVTGLLGLDNNVRITDQTHGFMKTEEDISRFLLRISAGYASNEKTSDPAVIYFFENSSFQTDNGLDAVKLMNTDPEVPNLYFTTDDGGKLSINALPEVDDSHLIVPMGLEILKTGEITFRIIQMLNPSSLMRIYLFDAVTNSNYNLLNDGEYQVNLESGIYLNRFALKIINNSTESPEELSQLFTVYVSNEDIKVNIKRLINQQGYLALFDLLGKELYNQKVSSEGELTIDSFFQSGIYILNYRTGNEKESLRLFIK